jgi:hypothetical protein
MAQAITWKHAEKERYLKGIPIQRPGMKAVRA